MKSREEMSTKFKWCLEDLVASDELWQNELTTLFNDIEKLSLMKGRLSESSDSLFETLQLRDRVSERFERLYVYAHMRFHEDTRVSKYQELSGRIEKVGTQISKSIAFIAPEILSISDETIKRFLHESEPLQEYSHFLGDLLRQKEYVLSEVEERLLAQVGDLARSPRVVFGMYNDADTKFPSIEDEKGNSVEVTKASIGRLMRSKDRRVRRDIFESMYSTYLNHRNTIGSLLDASVRTDVFYAKVRGYDSALFAGLDEDNIPVKVYTQLLDSVHSFLPSLHRYLELRGECLGLKEDLHKYDLTVPFVEEMKKDIDFDDAMRMVKEALVVMGDEYNSVVNKAFAGRWIDVFETPGKRSGGYSWGAYGSHPYILLNYQGTMNDVFTLAHEMGHAVHSFYSMKHQPYVYNEYKIFLAEIASTVNESLLMNYLLNQELSPQNRVYLLDHYIQEFRGTVFVQTLFAEFEKIIHELSWNGESLTADRFSGIYEELVRRFYGPYLQIDESVKVEWGVIPHFYSPFYVYQYATGFSSATMIVEMFKNDPSAMIEQYKQFLSAGNSEYPLKILLDAGVDIASGKPIETALKRFDTLVTELATAIKKL